MSVALRALFQKHIKWNEPMFMELCEPRWTKANVQQR